MYLCSPTQDENEFERFESESVIFLGEVQGVVEVGCARKQGCDESGGNSLMSPKGYTVALSLFLSVFSALAFGLGIVGLSHQMPKMANTAVNETGAAGRDIFLSLTHQDIAAYSWPDDPLAQARLRGAFYLIEAFACSQG